MRTRGAVLLVEGATRPYAISRPLQILDMELDPPGPSEVLIRVRAAGYATRIFPSLKATDRVRYRCCSATRRRE